MNRLSMGAKSYYRYFFNHAPVTYFVAEITQWIFGSVLHLPAIGFPFWTSIVKSVSYAQAESGRFSSPFVRSFCVHFYKF